jgi:membrane-associated protease RseP (regulator of RpoE activity)
VIVRWGDQLAPTLSELLESVEANRERDIRVEVLRQSPGAGWRSVHLCVRPAGTGVFGQGRPTTGMVPTRQEEDRLIVADIVTQVTDDIATPTAKLKGVMQRGSRVTSVNDEPVTTWRDLTDRFKALAGTDVKLAWQFEDGPEESATIHVPATLGTTFELPPDHFIKRIDGKSEVAIEHKGRTYPVSASNWRGASEILAGCIGRTIEIEHRGQLGTEPVIEQVTVTPEMLDTWTLRVAYGLDDMVGQLVTEKLREPNPLKAMMIGVRKTIYFMDQVYVMIQRMLVSRSVGLDQVSGPVGIVKMGSDLAERDFVKLLYFLALISANLAVINFLPLPIVDGGLFIFLIIEKLKGGPIPMRVQVATQLIGLAMIIGIFLYVTLQDIQRILGAIWLGLSF